MVGNLCSLGTPVLTNVKHHKCNMLRQATTHCWSAIDFQASHLTGWIPLLLPKRRSQISSLYVLDDMLCGIPDIRHGYLGRLRQPAESDRG